MTKGACYSHSFPRYSLYEFPFAAVTNYHTFSDLKQHKFILLQFWRSEIQNESYEAIIKVLTGLVPSGGFRGESFLAFFIFQRPPNSLAHSLTSHSLFYPCVHGDIASSSDLQPPSYKYLCDYIRPIWIIKDNFLSSKSLT